MGVPVTIIHGLRGKLCMKPSLHMILTFFQHFNSLLLLKQHVFALVLAESLLRRDRVCLWVKNIGDIVCDHKFDYPLL